MNPRPAAERPGAVVNGVTADQGPTTERAEADPATNGRRISAPPSGNGGRVPRYRSATGSASVGSMRTLSIGDKVWVEDPDDPPRGQYATVVGFQGETPVLDFGHRQDGEW